MGSGHHISASLFLYCISNNFILLDLLKNHKVNVDIDTWFKKKKKF